MNVKHISECNLTPEEVFSLSEEDLYIRTFSNTSDDKKNYTMYYLINSSMLKAVEGVVSQIVVEEMDPRYMFEIRREAPCMVDVAIFQLLRSKGLDYLPHHDTISFALVLNGFYGTVVSDYFESIGIKPDPRAIFDNLLKEEIYTLRLTLHQPFLIYDENKPTEDERNLLRLVSLFANYFYPNEPMETLFEEYRVKLNVSREILRNFQSVMRDVFEDISTLKEGNLVVEMSRK